MACHLIGIKAVYESTMTYCQSYTQEQTLIKIELKQQSYIKEMWF